MLASSIVLAVVARAVNAPIRNANAPFIIAGRHEFPLLWVKKAVSLKDCLAPSLRAANKTSRRNQGICLKLEHNLPVKTHGIKSVRIKRL